MTIFAYRDYCIYLYKCLCLFYSRFYTGVTVTDREVKIGTQTTLTCSLTELSVEVDISWWDGTNRLTDGKTFVQHKLKKKRLRDHPSYSHVTVVSKYWNLILEFQAEESAAGLFTKSIVIFRLHIESRAVQL